MERKARLSENSKNVINNSILSYLIRGGSLIIGVFTTPAYLRYFNNESVLGVWFTLLSILSWVLYFDMGIGHGLRNKIAVTITRGDKYATKKYISSAYCFLVLIGTAFIFILLISSRLINWNKFLNINEAELNKDTLWTAVAIAIISIILQFILGLITSILYALQKSFVPNLITLITNSFLLVFVLLCNALDKNNDIIRLSVAFLIAVNLPLIIITLYLFVNTLYYARPSIKFFDMKYALDTLKTGSMFLLIQLFKLAIFSTNFILIAKLVSSSAVVEFNIYHKIFSFISSIFVLGLTPIWSAVTRASAQNNYMWIKKVYRIMYGFGGLITTCQLLLLPAIQLLLNIWLGSKTIIVDYSVLPIYMLDVGVVIWSGINAYISNGLNELKLQVLTMGIGAALKVPLSMLGVWLLDSYTGVLLAHSLSLLPYCIVQTVWLYRHINKKLCEGTGFIYDAHILKEHDG